jgi:sulfur carrier protein
MDKDPFFINDPLGNPLFRPWIPVVAGMTAEKEHPGMYMNITLNGEKKQMPDNLTVLDLLELLNIQHQRVAVELNLKIVKKDVYGTTPLREGDSLEVVSFMAGGSLVLNNEFEM